MISASEPFSMYVNFHGISYGYDLFLFFKINPEIRGFDIKKFSSESHVYYRVSSRRCDNCFWRSLYMTMRAFPKNGVNRLPEMQKAFCLRKYTYIDILLYSIKRSCFIHIASYKILSFTKVKRDILYRYSLLRARALERPLKFKYCSLMPKLNFKTRGG